MKAIGAAAILAATLALTACGNDCPQPQSLAPAAMVVPMAPPKPPAPAPAPKPAPKAPAPAPAPKPAAPKPAAPKPYVPPPPRSVYRPPDPRMDRRSPSYNYRTVYVNHQTDHTPLLLMMAMNGMFDNPQPAPERCEQ
jgi:hypothetical protein